MRANISTPDLHTLQSTVVKWADRYMADESQLSLVARLQKEAETLQLRPMDKTGICECLITLLLLAQGAGMDAATLVRGALEKQRINELRR